MSVVEESQLDKLKGAYQLLEVPFTAPAASIKQSYRRLAKKWHPDLYPSDTADHLEAMRMMSLINEAYFQIAHAPLRYHIESYPRVRQRMESRPIDQRRDTVPISDRDEFWFRFGCGALLGVVTAVKVVHDLSDFATALKFPYGAFLIIAVFVISCGFASARYGNRFWSSVLETWWQWW